MFDASLLGESRPMFTARLDAGDAFNRWLAIAPQLACGGDVASIDDLFTELAPGSRITHHDTLLSGLLRLAALDGPDCSDAVLALLHAMEEGVTRLAARRYEPALVLGELTIQIRTYPWQTRTRAVAANLLRDTAYALSCEQNHLWMLTRKQNQRITEDSAGLTLHRADGEPLSDGATDDDLDLVDLLLWAERTGIVDARGVSMLVEYHLGRGARGAIRAGHEHVARVFGVSTRTSKRQCTSTLDALRAVVPQYLAA